jgi:hypothetical protein
MKLKVNSTALFIGLQAMASYYDNMNDRAKFLEIEKLSHQFEEGGYYESVEEFDDSDFVIIDELDYDTLVDNNAKETKCMECGATHGRCEH